MVGNWLILISSYIDNCYINLVRNKCDYLKIVSCREESQILENL